MGDPRQRGPRAADPRLRDAGAQGPRRRASHSLETVLAETVALLDEEGPGALTFRALAARLGGGPASIYWYVSGKDELLDRATDHVMAEVLGQVREAGETADPIADLRRDALWLFDLIRAHTWMGPFMMRDIRIQVSALEFYELMGQQVMRLGMPPRETFHAVSAVLGFVIGTAIDLGQEPPSPFAADSPPRDDSLEHYAHDWREAAPERYPYLRYIVDEFVTHDDADQFRAGLDLLLDGLRLKAEEIG